jgi:Tfp pilus assembly protein PilO
VKALWQRLSRREKGLVAAMLVIAAMVLARYAVVSPLLARREETLTRLRSQPQLLEKNLTYLARESQIKASLERARAELKANEPALLAGDTVSVSASDLQQIVQTVAAKEGVQVISTRVLSPEPAGSFTKIPIQIEVGGQIDQLVNLIRGIEAADKLLVIGEMNFRSLFTPAPRSPSASQLAPPAQPSLRATLTVSGLTRSAKESSAADKAGKTKAETRKSAAAAS